MAATSEPATAAVWIVEWWYDDDWGIEGVFASEASAQRYADERNADPNRKLGRASVERYEVQP